MGFAEQNADEVDIRYPAKHLISLAKRDSFPSRGSLVFLFDNFAVSHYNKEKTAESVIQYVYYIRRRCGRVYHQDRGL